MNKGTVSVLLGLVMIGVLLSLMVGCNSENQSDALGNTETDSQVRTAENRSMMLELASGTVDLQSAVLDTNERTLTIDYMLQVGSSESEWRQLSMWQSGKDTISYELRVSDSFGATRWYLSVAGVGNDTTHMFLTEKTMSDSLSIEMHLADQRIYETYQFNNTSYSLDYTMEEVHAYMSSFNREVYSRASEDGIEDVRTKLSGFSDFYPENSSLDNNIDGFIASELITDSDFLNWVSDQTGIATGGVASQRITLCGWANIGQVKCFLGGIANPLCHVAVGISIACGIVDIISLFSDGVE